MTHYEEAEGLTAEMVREWLKANGYAPVVTERHAHEIWLHSDGRRPVMMSGRLDSAIGQIQDNHDISSAQSLLRAINPRLHGWPSESEIEAHDKRGGRWIAVEPTGRKRGPMVHSGEFGFGDEDHDAETERLFVMGSDARDAEECEGWRFWPIDQHGNKLPRVGV